MPEVHQAFSNCGEAEGIEIWRIENFHPVAVPKQQYGQFYTGDSYIVLKTKGVKNKLTWDIHFWLGAKTTQDESGAAAIFTINLDEGKFHGAAVQYREVQGYESNQFLDYFKPAIRYIEGGCASGFNHVTTNAGSQKRFFQIKGKKNIRLTQVESNIKSMNTGDCFILDVDHTIFVYVGDQASRMEKMKANEIADSIREKDHNGRGTKEIIDQFSSEKDFQKFFEALGGGNRSSVPDAKDGGDDEEHEKKPTAIKLSEVSDRTGTLKTTLLKKPYKKAQLKTEECYILDAGQSGIYVWVGRKSNENERKGAMNTAQEYKKTNNLPSHVPVSKVPEGIEPPIFKSHFQWD